jgi:Zn-dependent peptidase ImmA (M78 family)/transcriptional regulator with XRE-family HTH domain
MTEAQRPPVLLFDPRRLTLARHLAQLRKVELAAKIGVTAAAVSQYEHGHSKPSPGTLARLALVLNMPVEFFADDGRPTPTPQVSMAHFRSLRATKQLDRQHAVARAALVSEIMLALDARVEFPAVDLPDDLALGSHADVRDIELSALEVRRRWGVPSGPVGHVVRTLEAHGVLVARLSGLAEHVDAFSQWFEARPIVVLTAEKGDAARSRFDAAHELAHLVLHPDPEPGNPIFERQAHRFAAAFLMPANEISRDLPKRLDFARYAELKRTWGVSIQSLLFRARTLEIISESAYARAMATMSARGWRRVEPAPIGALEMPVLMRKALDLAATAGYSAESLADDTRLPLSIVEEALGAPSRERPRVRLVVESEEPQSRFEKAIG